MTKSGTLLDQEYSRATQRSHSRNRKEEIQTSIKRVRDVAAICSAARVHGLNERSTVHGNGYARIKWRTEGTR